VVKAPEDMDLVLDDGETIWSIERYVINETTASSNDLMETLDLANISEDDDLGVEIVIEPPFTVDGEEPGLRAHYLDDGVEELHQVNSFLLDAKVQVRVSDIKLTHKKLADLDVTYAYGRGQPPRTASARHRDRAATRPEGHDPRQGRRAQGGLTQVAEDLNKSLHTGR
jgi:hypothetical protein